MAWKQQETLTAGDVVIPPEEQTPLVVQLVHVILHQQREIEKLRDEVNRQKGSPKRPDGQRQCPAQFA